MELIRADSRLALATDGGRGGGVGCRRQLDFKQTAPGQDCPLSVCYPCMYYSADLRRMNFPRRAQAGCITQQHPCQHRAI